MSLRLPNAPMEGLSIDVKKFASDASTFFSRAKQYTEEQLGQVTEKTPLCPEVDHLWGQFEVTNSNITKMKEAIEALLQPNPNLRMEKFVLSKIDSGNQLGRPEDRSNFEQLGYTLSAAAKPVENTNKSLFQVLGAMGTTETEIANDEKNFVYTTRNNVVRQFHSFIENDAKTIFKEKRILETKRLDLDAAKAKLKKVKTLEMRDQVENEVQGLQIDFDRQQELLKLLLEGVSAHQSTQLRALQEFVDCQTKFLQSAAARAEKLQLLIHSVTGDISNSSSFPRRNSANIPNNVPVADILKNGDES